MVMLPRQPLLITYLVHLELTVSTITGVAATFTGVLDATANLASNLTGTPQVTVSTLTGVAASFTGAVSIGGTLTYEDVTNVDSIGVITARSGVHFGATGAGTLVEGNATGIGIGTDNPQSLLDVDGGADNPSIRLVRDTGGGDVGSLLFVAKNQSPQAQGRIDYRGGASNDGLKFTSGGTQRMVIDTSGLVGIGTDNPLGQLHVSTGLATVSSVQASGSQLVLENNTNTGLTILSANDSLGAILFGDEQDNDAGRIRYEHNTNQFSINVGDRSGTQNSSQIMSWFGINEGLTTIDIIGGATNVSTIQTDISALDFCSRDASVSDNNTGNTCGQIKTINESTNGSLVGMQINVFDQTRTNGDRLHQAVRYDFAGRTLVGTSTCRATFNNTTNTRVQLNIEGTSTDTSAFGLVRNSADASHPTFILGKSRGSQPLDVDAVTDNTMLGSIQFQGADGTDLVQAASIRAEIDGTPAANDMPGRLLFSTTADGESIPTEWMRITSSGLMEMGDPAVNGGWRVFTADSGTAQQRGRMLFRSNSGSAGGNEILQSYLGSVEQLRITSNGNILNVNNSYGALSDLKLKENIVDASSQWDDLKALQVRNYNFKEGQTHTQIGLVAQEAELVSPGLVSESPDLDEEGNDLGTTTKSVNYSVLYMKAVKALQEAQTRIETLEAKVAALEAG
jgi:hypothetical protein